MLRTWTALATALLATLATTSPAVAADVDNPAVQARPAPNAELDAQPDGVTVAFLSNPGSPARLVVEDSSGKNVASATPRVVSTNVIVLLDGGLGPGTYTVKYRIEGDRGPEGGTYQFAIGQGDFDGTGFTTWSGAKDVPKDLLTPEEVAAGGVAGVTTPTASAPTPEADSDTGSDGVSGTVPGGSEDETTSAADETGGGSSAPLVVGLLALLVLAGGGGWWWFKMRGRTTPPIP